MADEELDQLESEMAAAEVSEATINVAAATNALGIVIEQLKNTRKLLQRYTLYFRIAVGIGVVAILMAATGAVAQYHFNERLEQNQENIEQESLTRAYEDCQQTNQGRENLVGVFTLLGQFAARDDSPEEREDTEQQLAEFLALIRENFPPIDCPELPEVD